MVGSIGSVKLISIGVHGLMWTTGPETEKAPALVGYVAVAPGAFVWNFDVNVVAIATPLVDLTAVVTVMV